MSFLNRLHVSDTLAISRLSLGYAALAVCLYDVALLAYLPVAFIGFLLVLVLAKVISAFRAGYTLPKTLLFCLAIVGMVIIAWTYGFRLTRNSAVCLFLWVMHLKLYELETVRDLRFFALFSLMIGFVLSLFAQSLWFGCLLVVGLVFVLVALLDTGHPPSVLASSRVLAKPSVLANSSILTNLGVLAHSRKWLLQVLRWLALALPLALIMFVLFPRPPSAKLSPPEDTLNEMKGISNEMRIDSIQSLSKSNAVAFRAKLSHPPSSTMDLYWRGPVMSYFNGRHWRTSRKLQPLVDWRPPSEKQWIEQEILVEPTNQPWLYALDAPVQIEALDAYITRERTISRQHALQRALKYRVWSAKPRASSEGVSQYSLRRYLQLPEDAAPKAVALATAWGDEAAHDPRLVLAKAKSFFKQGFQYTQNPPLLRSDMVDDFLFRTKTGFCEHFSSAFVVMMRAAGVPARVVVGYHGGELNTISGYYVLRHTDAHAWAEIWLKSEGWVRVDPTQWASTIESDETRAASSTRAQAAKTAPKAIDTLRSFSPTFDWKPLTQFKDYVEQQWQEHVIEYNHQEQHHAFKSAMQWIKASKQTLLLVLMMVFFVLFILACYLQYRPYWKLSVTERLWYDFTQLFSVDGIVQHPYEGPLDFAKRCIAAHPEAQQEVFNFVAAFNQSKFGVGGSVDQTRHHLRVLKKGLKHSAAK